jgi:hypothetical protein
MERVIDCPVCYDTDNCFEDIQENYSSYLCFHCGFMSDSRYEISSLQLVENLKKSPRLDQKLKFEDKHRNTVWFPSVINMGELGMIFPEGTPEEYVWKYAKVVDIPKEEQHKYDNYDKRLEVENAKEYGQYEFLEACKEMGITRDLKQNA